jgi:hypothetical protein
MKGRNTGFDCFFDHFDQQLWHWQMSSVDVFSAMIMLMHSFLIWSPGRELNPHPLDLQSSA